jgi:hypothetical protein
MSLTPLTERDEIIRAFGGMSKNLRRSAETFTRKIGWHGGGGEFRISWRPKEHLWFYLDENREQSRYWLAFGTSDPTDSQNLTMIGEINPTKVGINRRNGGAFVRDNNGTVYLAHSGKVGGGRKGIGKTSFLKSYSEPNVEQVRWPDGQVTSMIVIGRIDGDHFPAQVARFIKVVEGYKEQFATVGSQLQHTPALHFSPEFSGLRALYALDREIEARCDHGVVVNELAEILAAHDLTCGKTKACDLVIGKSSNNVSHLFEVKTELSRTALYTAIGQLMLNGTSWSKTPKRILILPYEPTTQMIRAIRRIGLTIVSYYWDDGRPRFNKLFEAIESRNPL